MEGISPYYCTSSSDPIERHLSEYFFSGIPMHGKKAITALEYFPIDKSKLYVNKTYTDGMAKFLSEHLPNWLQGIGNRLADNPKQRVEGNFDSIFSRHYTDNFQLRALAGCSSTNCLSRKNGTQICPPKVASNLLPCSFLINCLIFLELGSFPFAEQYLAELARCSFLTNCLIPL